MRESFYLDYPTMRYGRFKTTNARTGRSVVSGLHRPFRTHLGWRRTPDYLFRLEADSMRGTDRVYIEHDGRPIGYFRVPGRTGVAARGFRVARGDLIRSGPDTRSRVKPRKRATQAARTWSLPKRSPFGLRGFGQAEEVVVEATNLSIWPTVIAAGSVGVIVLGMVYAMGKETTGRAY